ncbi:hypothetical protein BAUCODRAFT_549288 [Baudoinia panamericana UAMH 10762]|uniref:Uncharacterized protein n=1 Tax=Baudoinia panamericana (strain UAMH 10762) TaxID=717646 RepID=M2MSJ5_BAUPA|nr:uncharacterized protein BAUCODRAFT_549288 [Baudoinia panamericana UAMH 10762]EMC94478.1 hypothetical protein BAUCODRAFT_549288 [Baudoinia panamericana UAMH 10762]
MCSTTSSTGSLQYGPPHGHHTNSSHILHCYLATVPSPEVISLFEGTFRPTITLYFDFAHLLRSFAERKGADVFHFKLRGSTAKLNERKLERRPTDFFLAKYFGRSYSELETAYLSLSVFNRAALGPYPGNRQSRVEAKGGHVRIYRTEAGELHIVVLCECEMKGFVGEHHVRSEDGREESVLALGGLVGDLHRATMRLP